MDMQDLLFHAKTVFENIGYGPFSFVLSLCIGILSAVTSACCTLPVIGAVAGYSMTVKNERSKILRSSLLFATGSTFTLVIIGVVVVFTGHSIREVAGNSWKIVVGSASILFGIGALELFPFKLPKLSFAAFHFGSFGVLPGIAGIVFGGAVAISSLPCNPGIFIVLGAAVLQQHLVWAIINLAAYAIGFSVPVTLIVLGFTLGKSNVKVQKLEKVIRIIAGIVLVGLGIYFFYTL
jgi:cytochrome c biogenesis protein CcdA